MNFETYQIESRKTAQYPNVGQNFIYPSLGLMGEFGELAEKIKKSMRDDNGIVTESRRNDIIKESGDVLWYIFNLASELGIKIENCHPTVIVDTSLEGFIFEIYHYLYKVIYQIDCMRLSEKTINEHPINSIKHNLSTALFIIEVFLRKSNSSLEEAMQINIDKLHDRKNRGVISGSGDNR